MKVRPRAHFASSRLGESPSLVSVSVCVHVVGGGVPFISRFRSDRIFCKISREHYIVFDDCVRLRSILTHVSRLYCVHVRERFALALARNVTPLQRKQASEKL